MYAESLGIQNASAGVETAAKWVQWAQYGIMQGASRHDETIRYNLNQFWVTKAATWPYEGEEGQRQLEYLDTYAHGIWSALEKGRIFSAPPTFTSAAKNVLTLGLTKQDRPAAEQALVNIKTLTAAQVRAAEASKYPAALAIANIGQQAAATADKDKEAADKWWNKPGPLGIPTLVWILAGGVAILGTISAVKGNR